MPGRILGAGWGQGNSPLGGKQPAGQHIVDQASRHVHMDRPPILWTISFGYMGGRLARLPRRRANPLRAGCLQHAVSLRRPKVRHGAQGAHRELSDTSVAVGELLPQGGGLLRARPRRRRPHRRRRRRRPLGMAKGDGWRPENKDPAAWNGTQAQRWTEHNGCCGPRARGLNGRP